MTVQSEIARLQAAKVDIMAALVEKGVDVTGKNLVDVPDLIDSIEIRPKTVRIGEHDYPYVKIGNLYWTTENLRENNTESYIYGNDPSHENKFGRLYPYNSIISIENIANGFRVPTLEDFASLLQAYQYDEIKAIDEWETPGTNKSGFGALPGGRYNRTNRIYEYLGQNGSFLTKTEPSGYSNQFLYALFNDGNYNITYSGYKADWCFSVRLCKDA